MSKRIQKKIQKVLISFKSSAIIVSETRREQKIMIEVIKKRKPTGRPKINNETQDLVIRLYNEDSMTCDEIAKACNISRSSVFRIIRERRSLFEKN